MKKLNEYKNNFHITFSAICLLLSFNFFPHDVVAQTFEDTFSSTAETPADSSIEDVAYYNKVLSDAVANVRNNCSGIKSEIDRVFGFTVATTASSGVGTMLAGSALVVGLAKQHNDYKLDAQTLENSPETFSSNFERLYHDILDSISSHAKNADEQKSKKLGNLRTGLMAGATVTSAVSTGTSLVAVNGAKTLGAKMEDCNNSVTRLKYVLSDIADQSFSSDMVNTSIADNIVANCTGFDTDNIRTLKNTMTASAVVSGVGTATGTAGTITSIMANTDKTRSIGGKKEKNLNLASNIFAGVTAGASATSTVFSATAISKAKKDFSTAQNCEGAL